jgi:hypothetical protein
MESCSPNFQHSENERVITYSSSTSYIMKEHTGSIVHLIERHNDSAVSTVY